MDLVSRSPLVRDVLHRTHFVKTLSPAETQRHLGDLIKAAPGLFEKTNEAAAFAALCGKLSQLFADSDIHPRKDSSILREILPLPNSQSIVREPWDEEEAHKPYDEIRWKFTHGPADAWRWCHVVDPETNAIHPPELAAVPGAFSGPEAGPV